jgi:hypothetical protein
MVPIQKGDDKWVGCLCVQEASESSGEEFYTQLCF